MERPKVNGDQKQREITGEIVYLDSMRRLKERPKPFLELADMAIQMYETEADMYTNGNRPPIMDEYERYESKLSEVAASCMALADELLTLKDPDSHLTFVDIAVEAKPQDIMRRLETMTAGTILADADEQLAIPSNGEHYPILDIRKRNASLVGVGLRIWGWDDRKYAFTNAEGEKYDPTLHYLQYPSDEKSSIRELELLFGYSGESESGFTESINLYISPDGSATFNRRIWSIAYAETGYEGHARVHLKEPTDEDMAAFGDLVAEIVGDEPKSIRMKIDERLQQTQETAVSKAGQRAVKNLIKKTWAAQADYYLHTIFEEGGKSIAELLTDKTTEQNAIEAINMIIEEWQVAKSK